MGSLASLGVGGGPTVFSPLNYSPYVWYKANTEAYGDGAAVGTMTDKSGNGRDATQSTAGNKPTFKTAILNGKSVYRFDGGDWVKTAAFASVLSQPNTIYIVLKTTVNTLQLVVDGLTSGNRHTVGLDKVPGNAHSMFAGAALDGGAWATGTWYYKTELYNTTSSSQRVNGAASGSSGTAGTQSLDGLTIGARYANDFGFTGDIAEILLFTGLHNSTQYGNMESYFQSEYAL